MSRLLVLGLLPVFTIPCATAAESSWIFRPSYFSHDPATGERAVQYAPKLPAYARDDDTYLQSGYRHSQTTIRVGDSADHWHIVETWGAGASIRPYGEWLRPFREGATPFGPWGNPQGPWMAPFGSWGNPYGVGRYYYGNPGGYGQPGYGPLPAPQYGNTPPPPPQPGDGAPRKLPSSDSRAYNRSVSP